MGELSTLLNIGNKVEQQLNEVGIRTINQLIEIGSRQAWLRIKRIDDSACINRLYALEGAIQGIRWHDLSEVVKEELREFFNTYKKLEK
ncbi:TfoX/Sxy family protein [uncultured Tissierella sp.]|uniref:TfoX/Sxy family protein n=1 Tax=uncultured Tissierella sp. TaxID=448160 RepID=UPI002804FAB3|nr:TfoX/Sxy family protein [uncultured Tissierella sp.]MDU5082861.1 TfoX/Sxy family protein [Bacillota bacterium]